MASEADGTSRARGAPRSELQLGDDLALDETEHCREEQDREGHDCAAAKGNNFRGHPRHAEHVADVDSDGQTDDTSDNDDDPFAHSCISSVAIRLHATFA